MNYILNQIQSSFIMSFKLERLTNDQGYKGRRKFETDFFNVPNQT